MLLIAAITLSGCDRVAEDAQNEYEFLRANAAPARELCDKASRVRDEWARRQNQKEYDRWKFNAEVDCLSYQTQQLIR